MLTRSLAFISKISSKFLHEVMPVALASVMGTMLVNHYTRQPASPSVVVQAPPPPVSADAVLQTRDGDVGCARSRRSLDQSPARLGGESRAAAPFKGDAGEDGGRRPTPAPRAGCGYRRIRSAGAGRLAGQKARRRSRSSRLGRQCLFDSGARARNETFG